MGRVTVHMIFHVLRPRAALISSTSSTSSRNRPASGDTAVGFFNGSPCLPNSGGDGRPAGAAVVLDVVGLDVVVVRRVVGAVVDARISGGFDCRVDVDDGRVRDVDGAAVVGVVSAMRSLKKMRRM